MANFILYYLEAFSPDQSFQFAGLPMNITKQTSQQLIPISRHRLTVAKVAL